MTLSAGTRLGPYEILGLIGAGGMGEVYKARDTRLDRTVAIKVLPPHLADLEHRARFEREAKTIAGLSHPHICSLYDVGEHGSSLFLVMEHLEGETLAQRLRKGALPISEALDIGAQIAEALSAAHRAGFIHRDLKPGNVMLTKSGVKLLDFGLAKLKTPVAQPAFASAVSVATKSEPLTGRGAVVGTLQYMAPEQLEGKEADARTDIWALGLVLYEMATGKRAFDATSEVSLIAAILEREPAPISEVQPQIPPAIERLIRQCLAKAPEDRPDTTHDVGNDLHWIRDISGSGVAPVRSAERIGFRAAATVAATGIAVLIATGSLWLGREKPSVLMIRSELSVRPAESVTAGGITALRWIRTPGGTRTAIGWTPDGRSLVFVGRRGDETQLYVRALDAGEARPFAGTEGARVFAVSPNGQSLVFWAGRALKRVPLGGGPTMELTAGIDQVPTGLVADTAGRVFFGAEGGPIWQVPLGGVPAPLTRLGESELTHIPSGLLPGERALLYTVRKRLWTWGDEDVVTIDLRTGDRKILLHEAADARYVPTGHLVFLRTGVLFAVRFDPERLEVQGSPVPVAEGIAQALFEFNSGDSIGAGQFAIAPTGSFAWIQATASSDTDRSLVAVDRAGRVSVLPAPLRTYAHLRVSPDGARVVVGIRTSTEIGLWVYDVRRGTLTPLHRAGEALWPRWSPDGQRVLFYSLEGGQHRLLSIPADGSAPAEVVVTGQFFPSSWAPGARLLGVLDERLSAAVVVGKGPGQIEPLLRTGHLEYWPEVSPDGRWLAYASNDSGQFDVYVQPYPGPGPRTTVSVDGGSSPAWHPNGRELFFLSRAADPASGKRRMMAVSFGPGSPPRIGTPRPLFEFGRELSLFCGPSRCFDLAPDGERFYGVELHYPPSPVVTHINLVQNWFEELKAKVPGK